jgi:hypothetical protein
MLWVTNNVIPAQEHFSSYIIQNRIIAETEKISMGNNGPVITLFAPKGEYHELPLLFINYLLRKHGWKVVYLGADVEKQVVRQLTATRKIDYLFVYHITNFTGWDADVYFEDLSKNFSSQKIAVAGTVVKQIQRNFSNVILLKSDKAIYEFVEQLN